MSIRVDAPYVDPHSALPKYYQLAAIIRRKIENGEWRPHDAIPSERDLQVLYSVSRTTIREALDLLEADGVVYRAHGRGTFVSPPKHQYSLNAISSFSDDMRMRGMAPGQRILSMGLAQPSPHVRRLLALGDGVDSVPCIHRVRLADGEPMGLHTTWLALPPDFALTQAELEAHGSLYALLATQLGLTIAEADQTFEATVATPEEAGYLHVPPASPLLLMERLGFSQARQPAEYTRMLHRADRYRYVMRLTH